jgi:hypothetical protein
MDTITNVFEKLSERQRDLIINNKDMFDAFCEDFAQEHNISLNDIISEVNILVGDIKDRLDNTIYNSIPKKPINLKEVSYLEMNRQYTIWHEDMVLKPLINALIYKKYISKGYKIDEIECFQFDEGEIQKAKDSLTTLTEISDFKKPQVISWESGGNRKDRKKKADLYIEILNLLEEDKDGMTKTGILRKLKKDNGSWRPVSNEIFDYLLSKNIALKINKKYYLSKNVSKRETPYHRKVYECLYENPKSITKILKELGYNNQKGRERLINVLKIMEQHEYVEKDGRKWKVVV